MDDELEERLDLVLQRIQRIPIDHEFGTEMYDIAWGMQEIIDCIRVLHQGEAPS